MILLSSFLWSTSMLFSRVCVNVHNSEFYMKILWMYVANTLILTFSLIYLLLNMDSYVLQESIVSPFRLLIPSSVSSSDLRYLHFFQASPPLYMWYLSVLFSFACKPSVSNIAGISLSTCLIFDSYDPRNNMSSAYFGSIVILCTSQSMNQSRADQRGFWQSIAEMTGGSGWTAKARYRINRRADRQSPRHIPMFVWMSGPVLFPIFTFSITSLISACFMWSSHLVRM